MKKDSMIDRISKLKYQVISGGQTLFSKYSVQYNSEEDYHLERLQKISEAGRCDRTLVWLHLASMASI